MWYSSNSWGLLCCTDVLAFAELVHKRRYLHNVHTYRSSYQGFWQHFLQTANDLLLRMHKMHLSTIFHNVSMDVSDAFQILSLLYSSKSSDSFWYTSRG